MQYKKSYKGFWLWTFSFVAVLTAVAMLSVGNEDLSVLLTMNTTLGWIALLSFIIYKTQFVYWYNGIEYEEALSAGEERRIACGRAHFYIFAKAFLWYFIYSCVAAVASLSVVLSILLGVAALISAAISTMKIKL